MKGEVTEYWFKPKYHGYGATPSHWKGWLATFGFVAVMTVFSIAWMLQISETKPVLGYLAWAGLVLGSVYRFTQFAKKRTDGEWAWRWRGQKYMDVYAPGNEGGPCGPGGCAKD